MKWIAVVALVIVGLLVGRQAWQQQQDVMATERDLAGQRRGIGRAETDLDVLDRSIDRSEDRLRVLAERLGEIEEAHPGGIPQALYPDYSRLLAEHNHAVEEHNALVARHDELRTRYAERVGRHNARVEEANAGGAERTGCSLLPGPVRRWACEGGE